MRTTDQARTTQRTYEVRHRTRYTYSDDVSSSYGRAYLVPRSAPGQTCLASRLDVEPAAAATSESVDFYGNRSVYFEVHTRHRVLDVLAVSTVEVARSVPDLGALDDRSWEQGVRDVAASTLRAGSTGSAGSSGAAGAVDVEARDMLLESPQVGRGGDAAAYAAGVFVPGRPLGEALGALVSTIHRDFTYKSGSTSVSTTLDEVLRRREGVCQDFAHLAVACLRTIGLPARYVSGYLETEPPPGKAKLQGADASHAWVSVLVPDLGWVDLDPTNDQAADSRYVVTAWGRDYTDVPPLKGVIFTEATKSTLKVEVDVVRVDG
ncbi:MAG: transglutaminase family protein [Actinobacteria bacterium]|nr:transglutaminase family protein [Actinomycetota bacterium]